MALVNGKRGSHIALLDNLLYPITLFKYGNRFTFGRAEAPGAVI